MFIDSHCHLDFPELLAERDAVLGLMRANGVTHALTISTTLKRSEEHTSELQSPC